MTTRATNVVPFRGEPNQLYVALRVELMRIGRGVWVRKQMSRGVIVSLMRRVDDGRRVIMISRDVPANDGARRQFERECFTVLGWLNAQLWEPLEHDDLTTDDFSGIEGQTYGAFIEPIAP